jgi:hypothetical protein
MTDRLPPPNRIAPLKAAPMSTAMDNFLIAYQTGAGEADDWAIVTDNVRCSALLEFELPSGAKEDAEAIAAIVNAYRTGRLVLAPMQ